MSNSHTKSEKVEICEDTQEEKSRLSSQSKMTKTIYGIFGQMKFATGEYLILIGEASLIGELLQSGSEILRVEKLMYIPLANATSFDVM